MDTPIIPGIGFWGWICSIFKQFLSGGRLLIENEFVVSPDVTETAEVGTNCDALSAGY